MCAPRVTRHTSIWYSSCCHTRVNMLITNIYNKKTKEHTLMELFTATGKLKKFFFWQLEIFDVCTTGDTAHIDTIFKLLTRVNILPPHTRQHVDACVATTWKSYRCVPCHAWCTHRTSLVVKKNFFSFPVALNNSMKVCPLVFLLKIFVITENIMKRPVKQIRLYPTSTRN